MCGMLLVNEIFWILCTRTLIFHMSTYSLWQDLFMGTNIFDHLTLVFNPLAENLNLGYIIWMVGTRALTFLMSFPCNETILWVPKKLNLWPWAWCMIYFFKTLVISFKWLWYFIQVFLWTRLFHGDQRIWPCDLGVWPAYKKL
jgi:hypothetical protein